MGEPSEEEDDPFAGMSATRSTVRRKSEGRASDAPTYGEPATIAEPAWVGPSEEDSAADVAVTPRRDESLARLELAARLAEPEPFDAPSTSTLPLTPRQLETGHRPPAQLAPTMADSVSAFGEGADDGAAKPRERRGMGVGEASAARTLYLAEAAAPAIAPPHSAHPGAPSAPAAAPVASQALPGWAWFVLGLTLGVAVMLALWMAS
ncbi:MAG: hypothetical protein KF729_17010 [Sandaracinaceae bacterium]|nr:hypothetical protein [Sandaracinaceae bacterium]